MKKLLLLITVAISISARGQSQPGKLTVEKIMRDTSWIGNSPYAPYWASDGQHLFFYWNPDNAPVYSLYSVSPADLNPKKTTPEQRQKILTENSISYNRSHSQY